MSRSPWYKTFSYYLFVGLPLIFLALLPQILSSESGKYLFLAVLNRETGLHCEIEELHLSWFGSQTAKKVRVRGIDSEAEVFFCRKNCNTRLSPPPTSLQIPQSANPYGMVSANR